MKLFYFLAGVLTGAGAYLIWKERIFDAGNSSNEEGHTFNINELVGENSVSLEEIRERLKNE